MNLFPTSQLASRSHAAGSVSSLLARGESIPTGLIVSELTGVDSETKSWSLGQPWHNPDLRGRPQEPPER